MRGADDSPAARTRCEVGRGVLVSKTLRPLSECARQQGHDLKEIRMKKAKRLGLGIAGVAAAGAASQSHFTC
jgi:hypothetical protein